jgi:hypothetical protein
VHPCQVSGACDQGSGPPAGGSQRQATHAGPLVFLYGVLPEATCSVADPDPVFYFFGAFPDPYPGFLLRAQKA